MENKKQITPQRFYLGIERPSKEPFQSYVTTLSTREGIV